MGKPMNSDAPLRVGLVGAGFISRMYFDTFQQIRDEVRLVRVADVDVERAAAAGGAQGVPGGTVDELMADPDVDIVLNLTIPAAHAEVAIRSLDAGKHVYGEKPLTVTVAEARTMLDLADRRGLWVGCAPDTVLGTGIQTARRAVDEGLIGRPIAATATMAIPGHEAWHPNPDFYYAPGGGPLYDMGPYYLHALITLLGPVARVSASASRPRQERMIATGPRAGERVPVLTDTHITGLLEHVGGAVTTLTMSFDTVGTRAVPIEVHGLEGSLLVPDPNEFSGTTSVKLRGEDWKPLPVSAGYENSSRGYGLLDFNRTPAGEVPRADAGIALHALEIMETMIESSAQGRRLDLGPAADRPRAVPLTSL
ncbi:MAG: oxidoreductase [Microbacterium sp.]|jgi:predicted dehydrogenase|nr:oxidoreductase [Microbacterium sp.]